MGEIEDATTMMDFIVVFALIGHHMMKVVFVLVVKRPTALTMYKQNVLVAKKKMKMGYIIFANHVFPIQAVRHATMKRLLIISRIATKRAVLSV